MEPQSMELLSITGIGRLCNPVPQDHDRIVKVGVQGLEVGKVWRPVSLVFFQVVMSML